MTAPINTGLQTALPVFKKTAKILGGLTVFAGGAIGAHEGVQGISSRRFSSDQGAVEKALEHTYWFSCNFFGGILFAPVVVSIKINEFHKSCVNRPPNRPH